MTSIFRKIFIGNEEEEDEEIDPLNVTKNPQSKNNAYMTQKEAGQNPLLKKLSSRNQAE